MQEQTGVGDTNTRLLRALAEELKLPLMQIARTAELANQPPKTSNELRVIETTADAALRLLDSYVLTTQLLASQQQLELAPVSVTAMLYDTAQVLYKLSKLYDVRVDIEVHGRPGQAMANSYGLQAALSSLAYTFISGATSSSRQRVALLAQNTREGIETGVISNTVSISAQDLHAARSLFGNARQPAATLTYTTGAGVYVADALFAAMGADMQVKHHRKSTGLMAILLPSKQLSLLV